MNRYLCAKPANTKLFDSGFAPMSLVAVGLAVACLLASGCSSNSNANDNQQPISEQSISEQSDPGNGNEAAESNTTLADATEDEITATTTSNGTTETTSGDETAPDNDPVATPLTDPVEEDPAEEVTAIPATNNNESSPVALLLQEIRLAATAPLLQLNRKLQSGEPLTETELDCLNDFNPANGQVLDSIACPIEDSGLSVFDSDLQIYTTSLIATQDCQQTLAEADSSSVQDRPSSVTIACRVDTAELLLPVVWVPLVNPPPSQIATVQPLQGADISYNRDGNGRLILQSVSDLFVPYRCEIDLATSTLTDEALSAGGCQQQVDRLIGRLFELRTSS